MNQYSCVALLFHTPVTLKASKRAKRALELNHLGSHIRLARYLRRLTIGETSTRIGVNPRSLILWEEGSSEPLIGAVPGILKFLGYDPYPSPLHSLADRLYAFRRALGLDRIQASALYGVGQRTWGDWELGHHSPFARPAAHLEAFLDLHYRRAIQDWQGDPPLNTESVPACFRVIGGRIIHAEGILEASNTRWRRNRA